MSNTKEQKLILSDRKQLELVGVTEVINFSENEILLESNMGKLIIQGEDLHIKQLDLENSKLLVNGYITDLRYDQETKAEGFFKRLFK
ncbi:sporulation protein YabP [Orenia marismortui]|uniref:Sporulation protein YabP n=1 Tax=Orenia marismortui TaxID=46469 RepID=A0A4R8GFI2_9FIRM|nr:sporulation protein YabP [Orenia marismortui]TDX44390.1 sporulation protein YabP [Orenia marismortui]